MSTTASQPLDGLLQQLRACLLEEQTALVDGAAGNLEMQQQVKHRLLAELHGAMRLGAPPSGAARQRIEQLNRLNELNAAILASRLAFNRARTDVLLGAVQSTLYGATGTLQPSPSVHAAAAA